jgi:hypothetical protein
MLKQVVHVVTFVQRCIITHQSCCRFVRDNTKESYSLLWCSISSYMMARSVFGTSVFEKPLSAYQSNRKWFSNVFPERKLVTRANAQRYKVSRSYFILQSLLWCYLKKLWAFCVFNNWNRIFYFHGKMIFIFYSYFHTF